MANKIKTFILFNVLLFYCFYFLFTKNTFNLRTLVHLDQSEKILLSVEYQFAVLIRRILMPQERSEYTGS